MNIGVDVYLPFLYNTFMSIITPLNIGLNRSCSTLFNLYSPLISFYYGSPMVAQR